MGVFGRVPAELRPVHRVVTPATAQMGIEQRAAFVDRMRAELVELTTAHGSQAAHWALEMIDALVSDLEAARAAAARLADAVPVPAQMAPNPLSAAAPHSIRGSSRPSSTRVRG